MFKFGLLLGLAVSVFSGCRADAVAIIEDTTSTNLTATELNNRDSRSDDKGRERLLNYARDPVSLLNDAQAAAQQVQTARLTFFRQERLGLLQRLQPMEEIAARYRAEPHSVYFEWITDDTPLSACAYVANENDGKVLLLNRKGLFGGPGSVTALNPELAVVFKQAKLPITDFGPREVLGKLLDRIEAVKPPSEMFIQLVGAGRVGLRDSDCYQIKLHFPSSDPFEAKLMDLFLHRDSLLVAGVRVWLTSERYRDDATTLDALYWFVDYETGVTLDNADFELTTRSR